MKKTNNYLIVMAACVISAFIGLSLSFAPFRIAKSSVATYTMEYAWYVAVILSLLLMIISVNWLNQWKCRKSIQFMLYHSWVRFQDIRICTDELSQYLIYAYPTQTHKLRGWSIKAALYLHKEQYDAVLNYLHSIFGLIELDREDADLLERLIVIFKEKPNFSIPFFPDEGWMQATAEYYMNIPEKIDILRCDIRNARGKIGAELKKTAQSDSSATALIASD